MPQHPSLSPAATERRQAIDDALADVRHLLAHQPLDRPLLGRITARLEQLAQHKPLFGRADSRRQPAPKAWAHRRATG